MTTSGRWIAAALLAALSAACSGGKKDAPPSPPLAQEITGSVSGDTSGGVTVTLAGAKDATATTDAWGRYAFRDLAPGTYVVTPTLAGFVFSPAARVATIVDGPVAAQGFTAARTSGSTHAISGTISGAGPAGVTIVLGGAASGATLTDAAGRWSFAGLADGAYTVRPSRSGSAFAPASAAVTVAGADVAGTDFTVSVGHRLSGTVSGSVVGLRGVAVGLTGAATASTWTDATGAWTFPGLADGTYMVTPTRAGYSFTPASATVTVTGGDTSVPVFAIAGATSISGTVSGAGGANVTISVTGTATATALTDTAGAFLVGALPPGNYTVTPSSPGYAFNPASSLVGTGSASNVTGMSFTALPVTGGPLHAISGTMAGALGGGIWVSLSGTPSGVSITATTATDKTGRYAFTGLASGSYTITPNFAGYTYAPASRAVDVVTSDVAGQDFAVTRATFPLTGTVTYGGTRTGRIYVRLLYSNAPGTLYGLGTSLSGPGPFTVSGSVSTAVTVMAWMDVLGIGRYDAAVDPFASAFVVLNPPPAGGVTLALADPVAGTPPPPAAVRAFVSGGSTSITFAPPTTAQGFEAADRYTIYWSDDASTPVGPANHKGSLSVSASSGRARLPAVSPGTFAGGNLWLAATSSVGGVESAPAAASPAPLPATPPPGDHRITGQIAFEPRAGGALVVTATDAADPSLAWAAELPADTSPQGFALSVPSGRYVLRAYLDDGNDGFLGQTDPSLLDAPQAGLLVTVDGADVTRDLTLPSGAAVARVAALHRTGLTWQVKIDVVSNGKLPVLATVTSGPGFPVPADLGVSNVLALQLGHLTDTFDVSGPVPAPGDAYEVAVTYADGTSETLTASVDQVLSTSPTPVAPIGWAASLTPTFTWSAPSTPPAGAWATFVVVQQHVSGAPAVLSPPLPSTQTSWTYAGPPLLPGMAYDWLVQAVDASGDTATSAYPSATFTTP